jgi:hypothetical protein
MTDLLSQLLQRLDAPAAKYDRLDKYYAGESPLSFLAPEAVEALGNRLRRVSVNIPRLLVDSVAERLRVVGFSGDGAADVWDSWQANDLDQLAPVCHREALTLGNSYAVVWADQYGRPQVSIESAKQVAVLTDPGSRRITAGFKRWEDEKRTYAVLYGPDEIVRYQAESTGATTAGFRVVESISNPLGVPPIVRFTNTARLLDDGRSEMADVLDLTDALTKLVVDMLVSSEYGARPRRFATGIELEETPILDDDGNDTGETTTANPFPETDRMMVSESADSKFGQLAGAGLEGYENAIGVIMRQISAVSGLPEHMLGIGGDNPTSADSIRASEAALTARAEARQAQFGRSWEAVAKLMAAVSTGADPNRVELQVKWADAATRSVAQEADAVVKLFQAGLLPASAALAKLGYSADEIAEIRSSRRGEALDVAGVNLIGQAS